MWNLIVKTQYHLQYSKENEMSLIKYVQYLYDENNKILKEIKEDLNK